MREKILAHRIRWLIGLCTFLVLFGCSGFPIYNFTTGRQLGSWYFMLMLCIGYFEIGQLLGVLYSRNKVWRSAALALGMTLLGLACRFLMEFGEVSNTCNFTPPNVALHLSVAAVSPPWGPCPLWTVGGHPWEKTELSGLSAHQLLKKAISCPSF